MQGQFCGSGRRDDVHSSVCAQPTSGSDALPGATLTCRSCRLSSSARGDTRNRGIVTNNAASRQQHRDATCVCPCSGLRLLCPSCCCSNGEAQTIAKLHRFARDHTLSASAAGQPWQPLSPSSSADGFHHGIQCRCEPAYTPGVTYILHPRCIITDHDLGSDQ